MPDPTPHAPEHQHAHAALPDCPQCLVQPNKPGSAKVAWAIAGIAILLLLVVVFVKLGPAGNLAAGFGGVALLSLIACPLVMGGMMWMTMRKGH